MAKEMMIVFVYDTLRCVVEEDDPAEAVLYFHPGWVSDSQRVALCGQLMGVTHCLKGLFSTPSVLTLYSGKFIVHEYGRYILAIGSDRNIPDWMLKSRANILTSLIKVYHCDLQTVAAQFPGESNTRFSEKLYQMFETYLPILQFGGYMFQTVPLLNLPKSATNIFLESMQILEHCQKSKGVLGGTILYNNKIVATQLNPKLTSHLAMVDPYRIKSPAESLDVDFDLPNGAQLLVIYVRKKYFNVLNTEAERKRMWSEHGFEKFKVQKSKYPVKEPILGSMKRDKSLLFTAVPEEDVNTISPSPLGSPQDLYTSKPIDKVEPKVPNMPDVVPFSNKPRIRPNKLALSFKHSVSRDSIDEDEKLEKKTEPIFTGQTSVCSTPMLEFKRLHGNVMSICRPIDDNLLTDALNNPSTLNPPVNAEDKVINNTLELLPQINNLEEISVGNKKPIKELKPSNEHFIPLPVENLKRFKSVSDMNAGFRRISQLALMRFGRNASQNINKSLSLNSDDSPIDDIIDHKMNITITDPHYPVFRNDGIPISKSLFNQYLHQHYPEKAKDSSKNVVFSETDTLYRNYLDGFDSDMIHSSPIRRKSHEISSAKHAKLELEKSQRQDQSRRKSLTLPLKPLSGDKAASNESESQATTSLFDNPRKKMTGVQLTPLMEKLSHLAFSEKSSGYSSRGITPMDFKDFALSTPCVEKSVTFPNIDSRKPVLASDDSESDEDADISSYSIDSVKCVLYVFGLQNMSMLLIMQENTAKNHELLQPLWETSVKSLGPIEQLCMEPLPSNDDSSENYSFLSLDPHWGAVKKGGPWASNDIATMGYMHNDFKVDPTLTEIIFRDDDSLVYGTTCGGCEIYYQESGSKQPGLPTPADLMGTAPLKSKRRLQRDHAITIF